MQLLNPPRRAIVHATCDDGYNGRVQYQIERPDGSMIPEAPKKAPTYALIALLVANFRLGKGLPSAAPTHWEKKANIRECENVETRRDPHEVRREEIAAMRKAMKKDLDS